MKTVVISEAAVREWTAYEEGGALVLGIRCATDARIESIILQIDLENSDLRSDGWGMYAELDDVGRYAVAQFAFAPSLHRLDVTFVANAFRDVAAMTVQLPSGGPTAWVSRMAEVFREYPRRGG